MNQTHPESPTPQGSDLYLVSVAITVTRTGGIAGLRRTWRVAPEPAHTEEWIALIDVCPWDAADSSKALPPTGADRYMWEVEARCGDEARAAALADPDVNGPWRELIDAVRAESAPPRTAPTTAR